MICYHATGTTDDTDPQVEEQDMDLSHLPNVDGSFHDGIWAVELRTYGDEKGRTSFVGVLGNDRDKVVRRWYWVTGCWSDDLQQGLWPR